MGQEIKVRLYDIVKCIDNGFGAMNAYQSITLVLEEIDLLLLVSKMQKIKLESVIDRMDWTYNADFTVKRVL